MFVNELQTRGNVVPGEVFDVNGRRYLAQEDPDTERTNVYRLDDCKLSTDEGWTSIIGGFKYVSSDRIFIEQGEIVEDDIPELNQMVKDAGMYPV